MIKNQLMDCLSKLAMDSGLSLSEFIEYSENKNGKYKSVFPENPEVLVKDDKTYIRNLKIMLAQNLYKDSKVIKLTDKLSKELSVSDPPIGWWLSEKWDGIRAIWDGHKFISRGSSVGNPKVYTYVPEWFTLLMPPGIALDGEMWIARGEFSKVSALSNLKPGSKLSEKQIDEKWNNVKYKVFDLPGNNKPFEERMKFLQTIIKDRCELWKKENDTECQLEFTNQIKIESMEQLIDIYKSITQQGAEGVMLRAPGSPYELKRSKYLLKYKIKEDSEAIVKKYIQGDGRLQGLLGSLRCELILDSKPSGIMFNIGTGFTDEQRERYSEKNTEFSIPINSIVSFSYMELSKDSVPRHPVYRGVRHDIKNEISSKEIEQVKIYGIQFEKEGLYGDFNWMINQSEYSNSLFIYNDDSESQLNKSYKKGKGNAIIRQYNQYVPGIDIPRSVGIPTGSRKNGGYTELNEEVKEKIDISINNIKELILKYNYKVIYYSADKNGKLGTGIFKVNKEVIEYITNEILLLYESKELKEELKESKNYKEIIIKNFEILIKGLESSKETNWQFKKRAYNDVVKALKKTESVIDSTLKTLEVLNSSGLLKTEKIYYTKNKEWKSETMKKIDYIIKNGNLLQVEKYSEDPKINAISELTRIPEIGPSAAEKLYTKGIDSIPKLIEEYSKNLKLLNVKQAIGLRYYSDLEKRIPREEMNEWNEFFQELMKKTINEMGKKPKKWSIEIVGSYRREKESSGDIDVLISGDNKIQKELMESLINNLISSGVTNKESTFSLGSTKYMGVGKIKEYFRHIDIFYYSNKEYPFALLFSTGSGNFNIEMRQHAIKKGYSLSEKELKYLSGEIITKTEYSTSINKDYPETEEDIFKFLQFPYKLPKNRM